MRNETGYDHEHAGSCSSGGAVKFFPAVVHMRPVAVLLVILWSGAVTAGQGQSIMASAKDGQTQSSEKATGAAFTISHAMSGRELLLGIKAEPYYKISAMIERNLVEKLQSRGLQKVDQLVGTCCAIAIRLIEARSPIAIVKKVHLDLNAMVSVSDSSGKEIYSRLYRARHETRTEIWDTFVEHAAEVLAEVIVRDDAMIGALSSNSTPSAPKRHLFMDGK
jgi:hypothetical protein